MVAGVTYPFFVLNGILAAELFLLFKWLPVVLVPLALHCVGYALHLRDPHVMTLWLTRLRRTPPVRNRRLWGLNAYSP